MNKFNFDFDEPQIPGMIHESGISYFDIVNLFEEAGLTDVDDYPHIHMACKIFWDTMCHDELDRILESHPALISIAIRNHREKKKTERDNPFWPPPRKEEVDKLSGNLPLGYVNDKKDIAYIPLDVFTMGVFCCGAMGTGKTTPFLTMTDWILEKPIEERDFNLLIIQGVKNDADGLMKKHPNLRVLFWEDLRYNMWQVEPWEDPKDRMNSASKIFAVENLVYTITSTPLYFAVNECYKKNGVFDGSNKYPTFEEIRNFLPKYDDVRIMDGFEIRSGLDRLANRFYEFMMEGEILNQRHGFPIEYFLKSDIILNVKDANEFTCRTTIMSILLTMQRYLTQFHDPELKLRTLVIIDEARWLFDRSRDNMDVNPNKMLEQWFTSSRESGFGRIILTQEPQSVSALCLPILLSG